MKNSLIYFDNAATTRVFPEVAELMYESLLNNYGNPSSIHDVGRHARVEVERARRTVAGLLNVRPGEVFFTSGGTESNNAILWACCKDLGRKHFITSRLEHPSVLQTLLALERYMGCQVGFVKTDKKGLIDLDHLEKLLKATPAAVVSLMHANNEIGNILPVNEVAALCKQYGALFHSDTVQTVGKLEIDMQQLGVDFAVVSGHKFHGPKGVGAMYIRSGSGLEAFLQGGAQERNMRAGTENVYGIVGMARALEMSCEEMTRVRESVKEIKDFLLEKLEEEIPGISFNGDARGDSLHTILNISLPLGVDADLLLPRLDMAGICISTGSACSSGSNKPSHVLTAMGIDQKIPNLRISFSRYNTLDEAKRLVEVLKEICKK
ncbi:MAG: cysteine desulfurase [Bacteroidales bacterium]|nr:cysteine desulfurase [Bacteroidales bacterium]